MTSSDTIAPFGGFSVAKWLLMLSILLARPAFAGDGLDVKDWLSRPGVKLLAVEFYASWCGPCKKAVPQWKALHEKYRDQGLRLIVVSVQDPDGACVNPGWNPDDVVCDTEGRIAKAWGVGDRLPAAYLWSWRGPQLVRKGHFEEVERAVREELTQLPRVTIADKGDKDVRTLLRTELGRFGKMDIVAGPEEKRALAAIRRESHNLQYSEQTACRIGERLAANSLLKFFFIKSGNGKRLILQLFSAETGCLIASSSVHWTPGRPEGSVAEAVAAMVRGLRTELELPAAGPPGSSGDKVDSEPADTVGNSALQRELAGASRTLSELEGRLATMQKAWTEVKLLSHNSGLSREHRITVIELYLVEYSEDVGHLREAQRWLEALRKGLEPGAYQSRRQLITRTDWFGFRVGGGIHGGGVDFLIGTFRWESFFLTAFQLGGHGHLDGQWDVTFGPVGGYPIYIDDTGRQELRAGLGLVGMFFGHKNTRDVEKAISVGNISSAEYDVETSFFGAGLLAELSYRYRFHGYYSLGAALSVAIPLLGENTVSIWGADCESGGANELGAGWESKDCSYPRYKVDDDAFPFPWFILSAEIGF
jgi:thiol-disulfide isomerase/thioredoxin